MSTPAFELATPNPPWVNRMLSAHWAKRVARVGDVKMHLARISIDRRLNGIPDIVPEVLRGLGVRVHGGGGIAVQNPVERTIVSDHHVRVAVVAEKRCQPLGALEHAAVNHQPAFRLNIG
jgi:hypothetical protein